MPLPPGVDAVWPFPHNWRRPLELRREFRTDVLTSRDRTPQRRALRAKPREVLEQHLTLAGREALACQQFLAVLQPRTLLVPVWPRICRLAATAGEGVATLSLDRPFPPDTRVGDQLVLMRAGAEPEAATLEAISGGRRTLTLAEGLAASWPAGAAVYPAWVAVVPEAAALRRRSAQVLEGAVQFQRWVDSRPPAAPYGAPELAVGGVEVLLRRINWALGLDTPFEWLPALIDSQVGPFATEILGRYSPLALSADVLCATREELDWWQGFFDRLRGRRGQFLTASHVDPLPLQAPTGGGVQFEVKGADLGRYAPHQDVMTHLQVRKPGGAYGHYRIGTMTPDFDADVTRITTLDPWDESYGPWQAASTWLAFQAHLASDTLHQRWHSAEVCEFTLAVTATERLPA